MELTELTIEEKLNYYEKALERIETDQNIFICNALNFVYNPFLIMDSELIFTLFPELVKYKPKK